MRLSAIAVVTLFLVAGHAGIASAQTATLPYDHVHLAVPDQLAAVEWYRKNLGGQLSTEGKDRVTFGKTRFIFLKAEAAKPSAGSAIDHIGFSFADVDAKMNELQAAGVRVITPLRAVPGIVKVGFVEDPWGVKIELLQDAETLGFHHVHLLAPDPRVEDSRWPGRDASGGETGEAEVAGSPGSACGDVWRCSSAKGFNAPAQYCGFSTRFIPVGGRLTDLETRSPLTCRRRTSSVVETRQALDTGNRRRALLVRRGPRRDQR